MGHKKALPLSVNSGTFDRKREGLMLHLYVIMGCGYTHSMYPGVLTRDTSHINDFFKNMQAGRNNSPGRSCFNILDMPFSHHANMPL